MHVIIPRGIKGWLADDRGLPVPFRRAFPHSDVHGQERRASGHPKGITCARNLMTMETHDKCVVRL